MSKKLNILFIMYDQLRFDYLSCTGHPYLATPNFDRVAKMGVRFNNTFVQSPICGASRMSFYTGRYTSSHGAQWNNFPLRVGEWTMGDHLRQLGWDCWLLGKTHMKVDAAGMQRLGLSFDSVIGARQAECGFDVWLRDDGLWAEGPDGYYDEKRSPYNEYLKQQGYSSTNPWADNANAGVDSEGNTLSGWFFNNSPEAANIKDEDSETPWLTNQTLNFLEQVRQKPNNWLAHVSYIKPHWPYIVSAPYNSMYDQRHVLPACKHEIEKQDAQPVYQEYMNNKIAQAFQQEEVRNKVIPTYMGLIKQCDDQLGRILDYLQETQQLENTMIVLTSDHGDYLGDHWLGEKDLFHNPSVKIPLIIYDPRPSADSTRSSENNALVEAIDLLPTFIETIGGEVPKHILEGRSLMPLIEGKQQQTRQDIQQQATQQDTQQDNNTNNHENHEDQESWRDFVISEYDYSVTPMCTRLGVDCKDARLFMVFDGRFKLIHAEGGFRPMFFDLQNDPNEFNDLAKSDTLTTAITTEINRMYDYLAQWGRRMSQRVTRSDTDIMNMRGKSIRKGIMPFLVDGNEVPTELTAKYRGKTDRIK